MQVYDLVMLIVLSMATIFGAIKGFAWQVASLASIVVSYLVAYRFRFEVAEMIQAAPPWNQFLAMLILYVGTSFVIWVGFRLLSGTIDKIRLKEFDRHMGAAFGLAKGLILCLLITMFAMSLLGPNQQAAICQSKSGYYIAKALDRGIGVLPKEIHDVVGPFLAQLDNQLKNGQNGEFANQPTDGSDNGWMDAIKNLPSLSGGLPKSAGSASPNASFGSSPNTWATEPQTPPASESNVSGGQPQFFPPLGRPAQMAAEPSFGSQSNSAAPQQQGFGLWPSNGLRPSDSGVNRQAQQPSGISLPR